MTSFNVTFSGSKTLSVRTDGLSDAVDDTLRDEFPEASIDSVDIDDSEVDVDVSITGNLDVELDDEDLEELVRGKVETTLRGFDNFDIDSIDDIG